MSLELKHQNAFLSHEFSTLPNMMTLLRIVLIPWILLFIWIQTPFFKWCATLLFVLASLTDMLDGYFARKHHKQTTYGTLLDPLADKFLVTCTLLLLMDLKKVHLLVVMVLICRELAITGLRAMAMGEGILLSASFLGKAKTVFQMIAIPCLILPSWALQIPFRSIGKGFLWGAVVLSLYSGGQYLFYVFAQLKERYRLKKAQKNKQISKRHEQES